MSYKNISKDYHDKSLPRLRNNIVEGLFIYDQINLLSIKLLYYSIQDIWLERRLVGTSNNFPNAKELILRYFLFCPHFFPFGT